jgi:hypothetical protein
MNQLLVGICATDSDDNLPSVAALPVKIYNILNKNDNKLLGVWYSSCAEPDIAPITVHPNKSTVDYRSF